MLGTSNPQSWQHRQQGQVRQQTGSQRQTQPSGSGMRCYLCGKSGHIARNCFARPNTTAALIREKVQQFRDELNEMCEQSEEPEQEAEEYQEADEFLGPGETEVKVAARHPAQSPVNTRTRTTLPPCRSHRKAGCPECFDLSYTAHHCQALVAVCQDCGLHHPVVADACQSQDKVNQMPVTDGTVEGKSASVLRDTGCSTVVVRRSLVPDDKMTGHEEPCILIDGTVRRTPVAEIQVETPYFSGTVMAVCMDNPLYDLVIGNIQGAKDPQFYQQVAKAVQPTSHTLTAGSREPEEKSTDAGPGPETLHRLQKETVRDVKRNPGLSEPQQADLRESFQRIQPVVSLEPEETTVPFLDHTLGKGVILTQQETNRRPLQSLRRDKSQNGRRMRCALTRQPFRLCYEIIVVVLLLLPIVLDVIFWRMSSPQSNHVVLPDRGLDERPCFRLGGGHCHGRSTIFSAAVCVLRSIVYLRISFESPARACMVFVWILCFSSVCVFACWFDVFCAPVYLRLSLRTLRRRSVAFSPVCRSVQRFCRVVRSYTANSRRARAGAGNCE